MLCWWQVRLQAMPEQACLLVSHPLLYHPSFNFFYQTVVLLCRHSLTSGTYGLALNKLMSTEAKAIMSEIMTSNSPTPPGQQQSRMQSEADLDLSRDLPVAMQGLGESRSTCKEAFVTILLLHDTRSDNSSVTLLCIQNATLFGRGIKSSTVCGRGIESSTVCGRGIGACIVMMSKYSGHQTSSAVGIA